MGYAYGANGLACDNCGSDTGGVRKRPCRFKVLTDNCGWVDGTRHTLHYCPAPAVCGDCFRKLGGSAGLHPDDRCGYGARRSQLEYDRKQARLDRGEVLIVAAWGSWHDDVPRGWCGLKGSDDRYYLLPADDYHNRGGFLADYPSALLLEDVTL